MPLDKDILKKLNLKPQGGNNFTPSRLDQDLLKKLNIKSEHEKEQERLLKLQNEMSKKFGVKPGGVPKSESDIVEGISTALRQKKADTFKPTKPQPMTSTPPYGLTLPEPKPYQSKLLQDAKLYKQPDEVKFKTIPTFTPPSKPDIKLPPYGFKNTEMSSTPKYISPLLQGIPEIKTSKVEPKPLDVDTELKKHGLPSKQELEKRNLNPEFIAKNPGLGKLLSGLSSVSQKVEKWEEGTTLGKIESRAGERAAQVAVGKQVELPTTGNKVLDFISDVFGTAVGYSTPMGAGSMAMQISGGAMQTPQVANILGRVPERLEPIARAGMRGATSGALVGGSRAALAGKDTKEMLKSAGSDAAYFAIADTVVSLLAPPIIRAVDNTIKKVKDPLVNGVKIRYQAFKHRNVRDLVPVESTIIRNNADFTKEGFKEYIPKSGIWIKIDESGMEERIYETVMHNGKQVPLYKLRLYRGEKPAKDIIKDVAEVSKTITKTVKSPVDPTQQTIVPATPISEITATPEVAKIPSKTTPDVLSTKLSKIADKVKTERGTTVNVKYAVIDADNLISSHDKALNVNPNYPQELQPRDRSRVASEIQVEKIAKNIEPSFLGKSPKASEGAPIIGNDMVVESGNARVIALNRAYDYGTADDYKKWLIDNAKDFGLNEDAILNTEKPVLVRVRESDVDRVKFAQEANEQSVASMGATEQAMVDAQRLDSSILSQFHPSEDGNLLNAENRDFVSRFLSEVVGPTEQGNYIAKDGSISQDGVRRMQNAVFAKAYGDTSSMEKLSELTDSNIKNITNSMLAAAPRFIEIKEGIQQGNYFELDMSNDVAQAANKLSSLREMGMSVDLYLKQTTLFEDDISDVGKDLLDIFDRYKRSSKKMTSILQACTDAIEALGHPDQIGMFGVPDVTKAEILEAALRRVEGVEADQTSLFQDETGGREKDITEVGGVPTEEGTETEPEEIASQKTYTVYRRDTKDADLTATKPQGMYFSLVEDRDKFRTPHKVAGDTDYWGNASPKNPLMADEIRVEHSRFGEHGSGEASAGVAALKKLVSEEEFSDLLQMDKKQLIEKLDKEFPGPDYSKYYDSYELLEAYAANLARQQGYDSIILKDTSMPEFSEIVVLDDNIVELETGQGHPVEKAKSAEAESETVKTKPETTSELPIEVSPSDIPFDAARNAYRNVSFDPEERAKADQRDYANHMNSLYKELKSLAKTDDQKKLLKSELERYRDKYIEMYLKVAYASSKTASTMITGPANFPHKRNQKAMDAWGKRLTEFTGWQKKAKESIKKKIDSAMPQEVRDGMEYQRLNKEALDTVATLKGIEIGKLKGMNASLFRNSLRGKLQRSYDNGNHDIVRRVLNEIKELQNELKRPVFAKNNRIWSLLTENPKVPEVKTGENVISEYAGVQILENFDDDKTRIVFDEKPSQEVIKALKSEGWRWSRANIAWQRKLTNAANNSAKNIVGKYYQELKAEKGGIDEGTSETIPDRRMGMGEDTKGKLQGEGEKGPGKGIRKGPDAEEYNKISSKFKHIISKNKPPEKLYRGMEEDEFKFVIKNRYIKSSGKYNLSSEKGRTLLADNYNDALSYATSFAPKETLDKFTKGQKAYLVEIQNTPELKIGKNREELGDVDSPTLDGYWATLKNIPVEQITGVTELTYSDKGTQKREMSTDELEQLGIKLNPQPANDYKPRVIKDKNTGKYLIEKVDDYGNGTGLFYNEKGSSLIDIKKWDDLDKAIQDYWTEEFGFSGEYDEIGGTEKEPDVAEIEKSAPKAIVNARPDIKQVKVKDTVKDYPELKGGLMDHQAEGVNIALEALNKTGGFLLADGAGAGKTAQGLAIAHIKAKEGKKKILILTERDAVIKDAWQSEAKRMFGDDKVLKPWKGSMEEDGIYIASYTKLRTKNPIPTKGWDLFIADESHNMKNWKSGTKQALAGLELIENTKEVMFMSATPFDRLQEVYYLGVKLGTFKDFAGFEKWLKDNGIGKRQRQIRTGRGTKTIEEYYPLVSIQKVMQNMRAFGDKLTQEGLMLKREVRMDGLDVDVREIELPAKAYNELDKISESYGPAQRALAMMSMRRHLENYKIDEAVELAKKELEEGRQVAIFAGYKEASTDKISKVDSVSVIKELRTKLEKIVGKGNVAEIHGGLKGEKRPNIDKEMTAYQQGEKKVAISTMDMGSTGISLHDEEGIAPRTQIMLTLPWSALKQVQVAGRSHRLTSKSNTRLVALTTDTEIDQRLTEILSGKMRLLGAAVQGDIDKLNIDRGEEFSDVGDITIDAIGEKAEPEKTKPVAESIEPGGPVAIEINHSSKQKEWIAEITGTDKKYKFKREFLKPVNKDWSSSGKTGTTTYQLEEGRIYDISPSYKRRYFAKVENGKLVEVPESEIEETFGQYDYIEEQPFVVEDIPVDRIRAIPKKVKLPNKRYYRDLFDAAKKLGTPARYKHLERALGKAEKGEISLTNIENTATASHELGHQIDFAINDNSYPSRIKQRFPDYKENALRYELKEVSLMMRPTKKLSRYRNKSEELMADYISLYLLDPDLAEKMAPTMTKAFIEKLSKYKDVQNVVDSLHKERAKVADDIDISGIKPEYQYKEVDIFDESLTNTEKTKLAVKFYTRKGKSEIIKVRMRTDRWEKTLSPEQLEDIGAMVEGIENIRTGKTLDEIKKEATPEMKQILKEYQFEIEKLRQDINEALRTVGDDEYISYIEDYLPHFYKFKGSEKHKKAAIKRWARTSPNAKQRKLMTLDEAIKAGFEPISQNVAILHRRWAEVNWRMATNRLIFKQLKDLKLMKRPDEAPSDWVRVDHPLIRQIYAEKGKDGRPILYQEGAAIEPDAYAILRGLLENPISHPVLKAVEAFNAYAKSMTLSLSLFHYGNLTESAQAVLSSLTQPIGGMVIFGKDAREILGTRFAQPHKLGLGLIRKSPEFVEDALMMGLDISPIQDAQAGRVDKSLQELADKTENIPGLRTATRAIKTFKTTWDRKLWGEYLTGLKAYSYYAVSNDILRQIPDDVTPDEIVKVKEKTAEMINDAYGGQEWETKTITVPKYIQKLFSLSPEYSVSPNERRILQMLILAPDYTISNINIAIKGFKGGKDQTNKTQRKIAAKYWTGMLVSMFAFINAANYVLNNKPASENEVGHEYDIDVTNIIKTVMSDKYDGRKYYAKLGKQAREVVRYLTNPVEILGSKASPVIHTAVEQFSGSSLGHYWDMDWKKQDMSFYESLPSRTKTLMQKFVPMSLQGGSFAFTFPMQKGMSRWKAQKAAEDLIKGTVDPTIFQQLIPSKDARERFDELKEACELNSIDFEEVVKSANTKVRSEYYGKMWDALERGKNDEATKAAKILKKLGATKKTIKQSYQRRYKK